MSKLVVVDPGHGGHDPGAQGHGLNEADLTLAISKRLRNQLARDFDVDVKLTRSDDTFVALDARAAFANDQHADYFVSVHINSSDGSGTGYESYIHPSASADSPTAHRRTTLHHAATHFLTPHGVQDRGPKTANFAVLRQTKMPAVLTENLFIDNDVDAQLLKDDTVLRGLAHAYANGIATALALPRK
jgi:N-acetylmuramoyl-L-alanine amidase